MIVTFAAVPIWVVDLGTSDGGFLSGGETAQWEWGQPSVGPTTYGPMWGTNLDGPYLHDTTDWLQIQLPDLSAIASPTLLIEHWYEVRDGDSALLQIDAGSGFITLDPATGYPAPLGFVGSSVVMVEDVFDLSGQGNAPVVRLVLSADAAQADAGWFVQTVSVWDGDLVVPSITAVTMPIDTQDFENPYTVEVDITEDRLVSSVDLWFDDGSGPVSIAMSPEGSLGPSGSGRYQAAIPQSPVGTTLTYWVEATDGDNVGRYPEVGTRSFRVFLAAPTHLSALAVGDRPVATSAVLSWDPPESPHPVIGYEVRREDTAFPVAAVDTPPAIVSLGGEAPQRFTVSALYGDVGGALGDPSEVLELDIEVPELSLDPPIAYQGEELYIKIVGQSLYLLQSTAIVSLGPDIDLLDLDVRDTNMATARVKIGMDAATGTVDLVLGSSAGTLVFPDRFTILSGDDAPRIERIDPAFIRQGEERWFEVEATELFAALPAIGTDDDMVVTSAVAVEGQVARFELAVAARARLGAHTLSIDDGDRLYTVELQVDEAVAHVQHGCASIPTPRAPSWLAGLMCAAIRSRRRAREAPREPASKVL